MIFRDDNDDISNVFRYFYVLDFQTKSSLDRVRNFIDFRIFAFAIHRNFLLKITIEWFYRTIEWRILLLKSTICSMILSHVLKLSDSGTISGNFILATIGGDDSNDEMVTPMGIFNMSTDYLNGGL